MPIRMPVVNGTAFSPAASSVASRRSGFLSGEAQCAISRPSSLPDTSSSMIPCDTETLRNSRRSSPVSTPGLAWGNSPVSFSTSSLT